MKPNRRLEGYDQYKLKNEKVLGSSAGFLNEKNENFKKNIKKIQDKTSDQNIEEEYIKGLQDEIKYLEYELKLLKDKELEQQASLSQLDRFFNDGVPLNENILAIKNQYNVTKQDGEIKLKVILLIFFYNLNFRKITKTNSGKKKSMKK